MNIFIDTTLTCIDPFLQSFANKTLLKYMEATGGTIYMSTVVVEETKEHLRKNISERIKKLKKDIEEYNKLVINKIDIAIEAAAGKHVKELEDYYQKLVESEILVIVQYENDILPDIVDRAIKRKKPFSENKDEFRDTIIWMSYAKMINKYSLKNSYFITGNTSDYYDDDKINLHPDLKQDCENVQMVKSSKELVD